MAYKGHVWAQAGNRQNFSIIHTLVTIPGNEVVQEKAEEQSLLHESQNRARRSRINEYQLTFVFACCTVDCREYSRKQTITRLLH